MIPKSVNVMLGLVSRKLPTGFERTSSWQYRKTSLTRPMPISRAALWSIP
ncbi:hypothetical protein [Roseicitreum antarcticum]|nr:hypothetical protein [Roseicitreum antarcticum]